MQVLPPRPDTTAPTAAFKPWDSDEVLRPLYDQLRAIARARLRGDGGSTLSPTALVNEALLRLLNTADRPGTGGFRDETHFIASAATAMRHVAVDYARRKSAAKRQGEVVNVTENDAWASTAQRISPETLLDINAHFERLFAEDSQLAQLVELRVFGGLTFIEIGALLNMQPKTAERRWHYASAMLKQRMQL